MDTDKNTDKMCEAPVTLKKALLNSGGKNIFLVPRSASGSFPPVRSCSTVGGRSFSQSSSSWVNM